MSSLKVRVRFPNESEYVEINNFDWDDFRVDKDFGKTMFGWYNGTYVEVIK
mgnify:CR=1 FL=1